MKMKVAMVHRYYPMRGGVTTVVKNLSKGLRKLGVTTEIVTNVKVRGRGCKFIKGRGPFFYLNLLKYLKRNNFDLVHSHSFPANLLKFFIRSPIVFTVHGVHGEGIQIHGLIKKLKFFLLYRIIFPLSLIFSDRIIMVSNIVKSRLFKNYKIIKNLLKNKVEVISNSVDISLFSPQNRKSNNILRVLFIGEGKGKGFDLVLKWARPLIKKYKNIKFIVNSEVNSEKVACIKKLENFEICGNVSYEHMPKLYNESDIVILPSRFDAFGMVGLEAMACGKPIIVSRYCGIKDVIENFKNGIVCSLKEFPKVMERLITDRKLREKLGKNARKAALKLSNENIAKMHLKMYRKLIS